jgi:hypothetical protein
MQQIYRDRTNVPAPQQGYSQANPMKRRKVIRWPAKKLADYLAAGLCLIYLSPALGQATTAYVVQMGAFKQPDNATHYSRRISAAGFTARTLPSSPETGDLTYVVVGPFQDKITATAARKQLALNEWHGYLRLWPETSESATATQDDSSFGVNTEATDKIGHPDSNDRGLLIAEAPATTDDDILIIDDTAADPGQDILILEDADPDPLIMDESTTVSTTDITSTDTSASTDYLHYRKGDFSIGLDKARLEYGNLYQSKSSVNTSNYGHLAMSGEWNPDPAWEIRFGGRLDWYDQTGSPSVDELDLDYGDSFVRYRGENYRVTAGTQKIIWGRIDELPPTDRLSRADISRGILDPLAERRRAMPVMRFEGFKEGYKLDAVWIPDFRKAALADKDSVWYPVNKTNGTILGFESTPAMKAFVQQGSISDSAPDGDGGFGLRLSNTGQQFDYAATVQHVRQSTPYWQLDPSVRNAFVNGADPAAAIAGGNGATFRARYPRTWVAGGDFGFEALSATWRFEAAWISDTPVTRKDLRFDTVNSVNWAAGAQFYPGDSDVRVNLQITGINMIDAPAVLDRTHIYNFNGSILNEFGNNRWQAKTRFFIGLDQKDIYINPEISFIGWEPHELYTGLHYFNGDEETIGGYWENNSLLTLGWRSRF